MIPTSKWHLKAAFLIFLLLSWIVLQSSAATLFSGGDVASLLLPASTIQASSSTDAPITKIRYVNAASGVDSGDCSVQTAPCATIFYALSLSAASFDTLDVRIAPGTYHQYNGIDLGTLAGKSVIIRCDPDAQGTCIVDANATLQQSIFFANTSQQVQVSFDKIEFVGGYNVIVVDGGANETAPHVVSFTRCRFSWFQSYVIRARESSARVTVTDSAFLDIVSNAIRIESSDSIRVWLQVSRTSFTDTAQRLYQSGKFAVSLSDCSQLTADLSDITYYGVPFAVHLKLAGSCAATWTEIRASFVNTQRTTHVFSIRQSVRADITIADSYFSNRNAPPGGQLNSGITVVATEDSAASFKFTGNTVSDYRALLGSFFALTEIGNAALNVTFQDCLFQNMRRMQRDTDGAVAISAQSAQGNSRFSIRNTTFSMTESEDSGAISIAGATSLDVDSSTFVNLSAKVQGSGALSILGIDRVSIRNSNFIGNRGFTGGAITIESVQEILFSGCTFLGNVAFGGGGGVIAASNVFRANNYRVVGGGITIDNSTFYGNKAKFDGGAVFAAGQHVITVRDSTFEANVAEHGDGGAFGLSGRSQITFPATVRTTFGHQVLRCRFIGNKASGNGGAYSVQRDVLVHMAQTTFLRDSAYGNGGDVYILSSTSKFDAVAFSNGFAGVSGGCLFLEGLDIGLNGPSFTDCFATAKGGGVFVRESNRVQFTDVKATNNLCALEQDLCGGFLYAEKVDPLVVIGKVTSNYAAGAGGGLAIGGSSKLTFIGTLDSNVANWGGGIACSWSTCFISASAIQGNTAKLGGALFVQGLEQMVTSIELDRVNIQDNSADYGGAIFFDADRRMSGFNQMLKMTATFMTGNSAKIAGGTYFTMRQQDMVPQAWLSVVNNSSARAWGNVYASVAKKAIMVSSSLPLDAIVSGQEFQVAYQLIDSYGQVVRVQNTSREILPTPLLHIGDPRSNFTFVLRSGERGIDANGFLTAKFTIFGNKVQILDNQEPQTIVLPLMSQIGWQTIEFEEEQTDLVLVLPPCQSRLFKQRTSSDPGDWAYEPVGMMGFVECKPSSCGLAKSAWWHHATIYTFGSISWFASLLFGLISAGSIILLVALRLRGTAKHWLLKVVAIVSSVSQVATMLVLLMPGTIDPNASGPAVKALTDDTVVVEVAFSLFLFSAFIYSVLLLESSNAFFLLLERKVLKLLNLRQLIHLVLTLLFAAMVTVQWVSSRVQDIYLVRGLVDLVLSVFVSIALFASLLSYLAMLVVHKPWLRKGQQYKGFKQQRLVTALQVIFAFLHVISPIYIFMSVLGICFIAVPILLLGQCQLLLSTMGMMGWLTQMLLLPLVVARLRVLPEPVQKKTRVIHELDELEQAVQDGNLSRQLVARFIPEQLLIDPQQLEYRREIGSGAQGVVYEGELDRSTAVAIKTMKTTSFHVATDVTAFFQEATLLAKFGSHPNIVRLIGVCLDEEKKRISLVQEYCSGGSLADVLSRKTQSDISQERNDQQDPSIRQQRVIKFADAVKLLLGVASGLQHLHRHGLIHRDVKAENILLDRTGQAKLADFGLTRFAHSNMTLNVGTAHAIAPEVLRASATSGFEQLPGGESTFSTRTTKRVSTTATTQNTSQASSSSSMRGKKSRKLPWYVRFVSQNIADDLDEDDLGASIAQPFLDVTGAAMKVPYDHRADIYSFGILMYTIVTEQIRPYGTRISDLDIVFRCAKDPNFRPPVDSDPTGRIKEALDNGHRWYIDLMKQCWAYDVDDRPQSMDKIVSILKSRL